MKVKKVLIGANPSALRKPIPDKIAERKTVSINIMGEMKIFPDRSPDAIAWIEEIVPTLMIGRREEILKQFWSMPTNSWWEFDYGRNTLSLCSLEK